MGLIINILSLKRRGELQSALQRRDRLKLDFSHLHPAYPFLNYGYKEKYLILFAFEVYLIHERLTIDLPASNNTFIAKSKRATKTP